MVKGLDNFIYKIKQHTNLNEDSLKCLEAFIIDSGCPFIEFEILSNKAAGISKTDKCVISNFVFNLPIEYLLYIILHEVSHQYQYLKYGEDLVLDVYQKTDITVASNKLLNLEKIADRLSIKKTKEILSKSNIKIEKPIIPRYLNVNDLTYIKNYIMNIRSSVNDLNLTSIKDINDFIHNQIKKI